MSNKLFDDKEIAERILDKIDELGKEIVQLKLISIKQESNLKEHMRRSDMLEEQLNMFKSSMDPIKKHVTHVETTLKLFGLFATFAGIVQVAIEIGKFLK